MKPLTDTLFFLGAFVAVPAMLVLISAQVFSRYVLHSPLQWAFEANSLLLLISVFFCLPASVRNNDHIRMDLLYANLKGKTRLIANVMTAIVGIVFAGLLTIETFKAGLEMFHFNEAGEFLNVPYWPIAILVALSALATVLEFIATLFRNKTESKTHG